MIQPVIKWSGGKRSQADAILRYLPSSFGAYFEPFVGGGIMLYAIRPEIAVCGDICAPLIALWESIRDRPRDLAATYRERWQRLQDEGHMAYYAIRDDFNREHSPDDLLFLSRTCVNGLIRFNVAGEFNNSLHHTRKGMHPKRMEAIIGDWSARIRNVRFMVADYRELTGLMRAGDLAYLDPPYFHTSGRYYGTIDHEAFLGWLETLNSKGVRFMLSYDGKRGDTDYEVKIPKSLWKSKRMIPSGNSSFKKVMDGSIEQVTEALYLNF